MSMFYTFSLDPDQIKKFEEWAKDKPVSRACDGAQYEFKFIPTGLGVVTRVVDHISGQEIDLTDYDSW